MTSSSWTERTLVRDGVRLSCRDWGEQGGSGPDTLLLHGLAGHSGEWDDVARLLRDAGHRVVALDQRGHGSSERRPADVSRAAYVADVVAVVEELGLVRPLLVGQSLGGHTALLTAAAHPGLPRALVLVEAGPGRAEPDVAEQIGGLLGAWPVPFPSREAAVAYLGDGNRAIGEGWAGGLEERDGGFWPRFDPDVMVRSLDENSRRAFWEEWAAVDCPGLAVLGENGIIGADEYAEMVRLRPALHGVSLPGAGHDVHLERPAVLGEVILDLVRREGLRNPCPGVHSTS
ncbi:alpha/beta fold hydrolase [Streptomyces tanashiensis]|uniref:Alpha/beta hydrolase n=1 Tax=Streptomyces tanashiensis TaxID=67367 RepID=A0ABY6R1K1_9ACTN|nr:alpha/beta hydrolase [Streptomyces tanashiensis]UZX22782.1 alpha/beta hydrolase [Streptomyces tanashiensis]